MYQRACAKAVVQQRGRWANRVMGGYAYHVDESANSRASEAPARFIGIDGKTVVASCCER